MRTLCARLALVALHCLRGRERCFSLVAVAITLAVIPVRADYTLPSWSLSFSAPSNGPVSGFQTAGYYQEVNADTGVPSGAQSIGGSTSSGGVRTWTISVPSRTRANRFYVRWFWKYASTNDPGGLTPNYLGWKQGTATGAPYPTGGYAANDAGAGVRLGAGGNPVDPDGHEMFHHELLLLGPSSAGEQYDYHVTATDTQNVTFYDTHVTLGNGDSSNISLDHLDYDFSISAPYTVIVTDADDDGIADGLDPYPDDADNNGWGDSTHDADADGTPDVIDDDDGDGVANYDDEAPNDPTEGVAGGSGGTAQGTEAGPKRQRYTLGIWLDNTGETHATDFRVQLVQADGGTTENMITVAAGERRYVGFDSDEPFIINAWKIVWADGHPYEERYRNGQQSNDNGTGTDSGQPPRVTPGPSEPGTTAPGATELEAMNKVVGQMDKVVDSVGRTANALEAKDDATLPKDDVPTGDTAGASGIIDGVANLRTSLGNLGTALHLSGPTGSSVLTWTIQLPRVGAKEISLEPYASYVAGARKLVLWFAALVFAFAGIKTIRGALA